MLLGERAIRRILLGDFYIAKKGDFYIGKKGDGRAKCNTCTCTVYNQGKYRNRTTGLVDACVTVYTNLYMMYFVHVLCVIVAVHVYF